MGRRVVLPLLLFASACLQVFQGVNTRPLDPHTPVAVVTPVKAHLLDGSTVVFRAGVVVDSQTVQGNGYRYDLTLRDSAAVRTIPLDSIVGMEVFEQTSNGVVTTLATLAATAGGVLLVAGAAVAIFGSCPTFYTDSAGTAQLQAEGFSYSIAPIFESRDIDRLRISQAADGTLRLEVRNEALETHYINHLELLEVRHDSAEDALVDELNRIVVVGPETSFPHAVDRRGSDVTHVLNAHDGNSYRTDARTLRQIDGGDLEDWIDLTIPAPPGADSVAIVLRVRNSLLNTTLLYDVMLGDPGARSLDWVAQDLKQVGPALAVAQWYQQRMGMNIAVDDGRTYHLVAHLRDTGPIAWKDAAVIVPVLTRDSVRVRLSFPKDNWRIDRVAIASRFHRVTPAVVRLADVEDGVGMSDTTALASMRDADARYLQTSPGQRFTAVFGPTGVNQAGTRTLFLASQGYYIEWMRRNWLRSPHADRGFTPSDSALARALARWRTSQDSLETLFAATRIPVR
ncbi:MAG TPA: hypothetical protein VEK77_01095 [Gemmatimonadales bacterium]|nr:hypothetical protein [Gemmatimonadales bacterium]